MMPIVCQPVPGQEKFQDPKRHHIAKALPIMEKTRDDAKPGTLIIPPGDFRAKALLGISKVEKINRKQMLSADNSKHHRN